MRELTGLQGLTLMAVVGASILGGMCFGVCLESSAKQGRRRAYSRGLLMSVTRLIFVTTQVSALVWVFTSYGIAIYSTICLEQVYTMAELSEPAIHTILGVSFLKVLENVFEHNDGPVFGRSKNESAGEHYEEVS